MIPFQKHSLLHSNIFLFRPCDGVEDVCKTTVTRQIFYETDHLGERVNTTVGMCFIKTSLYWKVDREKIDLFRNIWPRLCQSKWATRQFRLGRGVHEDWVGRRWRNRNRGGVLRQVWVPFFVTGPCWALNVWLYQSSAWRRAMIWFLFKYKPNLLLILAQISAPVWG